MHEGSALQCCSLFFDFSIVLLLFYMVYLLQELSHTELEWESQQYIWHRGIELRNYLFRNIIKSL